MDEMCADGSLPAWRVGGSGTKERPQGNHLAWTGAERESVRKKV